MLYNFKKYAFVLIFLSYTPEISFGDIKMNKKELEFEIISFENDSDEIKEYVSIPRGVYMSRTHQRSGRSKHSHTCLEMAYVLSGTAKHIVKVGNEAQREETLTVGNYFILDYNASHIIYQTSSDFYVSNFLFQPSFVDPSLDKHEPFANLLKSVFSDIHLTTLDRPVANGTYYDSDKSVRVFFEKAWETYVLKEPGYRDILHCYISLILIETTKKVLPKKLSPRHAVVAIKDYLNEHYMENISLRQICKERHMNMSYTSRKFKELVGVTFETYLQNIRVQNACTLLIETDDSIDTIIEKVGYQDNNSFRKNFKRLLNTTPLKFRQLHK